MVMRKCVEIKKALIVMIKAFEVPSGFEPLWTVLQTAT